MRFQIHVLHFNSTPMLMQPCLNLKTWPYFRITGTSRSEVKRLNPRILHEKILMARTQQSIDAAICIIGKLARDARTEKGKQRT